ncbi:MAG: 4Fe-4S binding protein [Gemmatimonadota bacterium]
MITFSYRRLNTARKAFQVLAVAFLVAVPILNWLGVHWLLGTLYSLSIGELDIADPAMALQTVLLTGTFWVPLLLAAAIPVLLALVFGRVFCSWICPYNTLIEWMDGLEKRVFRSRWLKKRRRPAEGNPRRAIYWTIFGGLLLATLLAGLPLLAWLSAPGILSSQLSQGILGMGLGLELVLVLGLLVLEVAIARRFWCKYACPVGATLALARAPWTLHVAHDDERCGCPRGAEACHIACPLGLQPRAAESLAPYCYNCGSCVAACEKTRRGALRFSFARESNPTRTEVR